MTVRPLRVLVVDDEPVARQLIRLNLQLEGFEVFTAVDGVECLDRIRQINPDVITLDVMMPRLDGWQTVGALRADPTLSGIPLVLLTARAQLVDRERGRRLGVDRYLTKPFDPEELVAVVRQLTTGDNASLG